MIVNLTCEMTEIKLDVDEPLLSKGDFPKGMYYVGKGRLKVVKPAKVFPVQGDRRIITGSGEIMLYIPPKFYFGQRTLRDEPAKP